MSILDGAGQVKDGIWEVDISESARSVHAGWDSLDEFVESAAMTTQPDAEFESQGETYVLLLEGTTIVSRYEEPSPEDRKRLNSCAVVIFRGSKQKPLYFINCDEGLATWDNLCVDMGHPGARFQDDPPATGDVYLN